MQTIIPHTILNNTFQLSADRSIFWEEEKTLILSDLHLGKTGHFRKSGIAVPQAIFKEDMQRLVTLFQYFKPVQVIIIGDMFHSHANKENDFFLKWRKDFAQLPFRLIKGNHDILEEKWYEEANIIMCDKEYSIGNFLFVHDIRDSASTQAKYVFSGHIHPGIKIKGTGRQSLRFPCFYFNEQYAVLPAFSRFTGTHTIEPQKKDTAFAIIENKLLAVK